MSDEICLPYWLHVCVCVCVCVQHWGPVYHQIQVNLSNSMAMFLKSQSIGGSLWIQSSSLKTDKMIVLLLNMTISGGYLLYVNVQTSGCNSIIMCSCTKLM